MSIQSFSVENFQKIFDYENRKGNNLERRFPDSFSASLALLPDLKDIILRIKEAANEEERALLLSEKDRLREKRIELIEKSIIEVVDSITLKKEKITIEEGDIYGKQSYHFENTLENLFISKKIQNNIKRLYSVKPSHRNTIIKEIINLLEDKTPKFIVRTDIKSFFESIPQKKLLDKLNNDYLLSVLSKRFVNETIESFNVLTEQTDTDSNRGVPRGIGFSAYLAELFMRDIDNYISKFEDVIYYARYVDDIIVIFSPKSQNVSNTYINTYIDKIEKIIKKSGLKLNQSKTKTYNLLSGIKTLEVESYFEDGTPKQQNYSNAIEYLGYAIGSRFLYKDSTKNKTKNESIVVDMVLNKKDRYKNKIQKTFDIYEQKQKHNNKKAFKLLRTRIQYLTSNTQLRNNKENVFIGIFYSNRYINTMSSLQSLQSYLENLINSAGLSPQQKEKLKKFTFQGGFVSKKYHKYPIRNKINSENRGIEIFGLTEINSIWK